MGGQINQEYEAEPHQRDMNRRRAPRAIAEGSAEYKVDVRRRIGETRSDHGDGSDGGLQRDTAALVSGLAEGPEKQNRPYDVEQREKTHPQRVMCVPHVFGAAEQIVAREKARRGVNVPQQIRDHGGDGLAGKEQRVAPEKPGASEDHGDVAKVEKVRKAPIAPIDGHPNSEPNEAGATHRKRELVSPIEAVFE